MRIEQRQVRLGSEALRSYSDGVPDLLERPTT